MANEKICGIYCIENTVNHKKYIGQSKNIKFRWSEHKCDLKHNRHYNSYLQNSWNKYGADNFIFYILEECENDLEVLNCKEKFWVDYYNSCDSNFGYNLTSGGDGAPGRTFTEEQIQYHSMLMKKQFDDCLFLEKWMETIESQKTPIKAYTRNGFYRSFTDIHSAANELNIEATNICKILKGKHKTANEYTFCYQDENLSTDDIKMRFVKNRNTDFSHRRIEYIDDDLCVLQVFDSVSDCARFFNIDSSSISKVCRGKLRATHGKRFRYAS